MALFTRGFQAIKDKVAKESEQQARRKFRDLWLKDSESVTVRFLEPDPVTFYEYSLEQGRKTFLSDSPEGDDFLGMHLSKRPTFRVALPCLVREYEDPTKVHVLKQGSRFGKKLDYYAERLAKKGLDLTTQDIVITKIGTGTEAQFEFEVLEPTPLTKEEKKYELPEWDKIYQLPTKAEIMRYLNKQAEGDEEESTETDSSKPASFDGVDIEEVPF
jgi:hypothetical protein